MLTELCANSYFMCFVRGVSLGTLSYKKIILHRKSVSRYRFFGDVYSVYSAQKHERVLRGNVDTTCEVGPPVSKFQLQNTAKINVIYFDRVGKDTWELHNDLDKKIVAMSMYITIYVCKIKIKYNL